MSNPHHRPSRRLRKSQRKPPEIIGLGPIRSSGTPVAEKHFRYLRLAGQHRDDAPAPLPIADPADLPALVLCAVRGDMEGVRAIVAASHPWSVILGLAAFAAKTHGGAHFETQADYEEYLSRLRAGLPGFGDEASAG